METRCIQRRAALLRSDEEGLTLIELLLSLAIMSLLTVFVVGGLSIGRRAFDSDQVNASDARTDAAIQSLMDLVGSALPVPNDSQKASFAFEGGAERIRFVALSEGRSLRGGPHDVDLRRVGRELVVEIADRSGAQRQAESSTATVVVLRGVRAIHFEYFGRTGDGTAQTTWQKNWRSAQSLPNLVSLRIDFEDRRRNRTASVIALRQG